MKKMILSSFTIILFLLSSSFAQNSSPEKDSIIYKTEYNILYKSPADEKITDIVKKYCALDIYYPENRKNFTTVVWFHGGGLTMGERTIPDELKKKGIAVVTVDYRLSPSVKCPVYIEDAAAAVAWVFKNIKNYGGDTNKIVVSGHSAGGYLIMMIGLDKHWLAKYQINADRIAKLIPFSGQMITHYTIRTERNLSDTIPIIDEFAPLYHIRKDAPPITIITGDRKLESLGRYEENAYLKRMMEEIGHTRTFLYEMSGFDHMEMLVPGYSMLLKSIAEINK